MFDRFADDVRHTVLYAVEQSRLLGHDQVGTEHLLLALVRDDDSDTGQLLRAAGADSAAVHPLIQPSRDQPRETLGRIPFTPRAKQALEQALRVAEGLHQPRIRQPHLLGGLLRVRDSTAVRLLVDLGVDLDALADEADALATETEPT